MMKKALAVMAAGTTGAVGVFLIGAIFAKQLIGRVWPFFMIL